jgi:hypothetical protein
MKSPPFFLYIASIFLTLLLPAATLCRDFDFTVQAEASMNPAQKPSPYASNLTITSRFSAEDFAPDGDLSKKTWQNAEYMRFDQEALSRKRHPEVETRIASLWTAKYVYFAFSSKYSVLNVFEGEQSAKEKWGLWDRDVVEVFINPNPERFNHYYEFEVSPNNQWIDLEIDLDKKPFNDAAWDSHFEHATRVDEASHVWTCEMRIPTSALLVQMMKPGMEWRLNFYRADGKGGDSQRRFLSWSPLPPGTKLSFHQPASFGIIRFVK